MCMIHAWIAIEWDYCSNWWHLKHPLGSWWSVLPGWYGASDGSLPEVGWGSSCSEAILCHQEQSGSSSTEDAWCIGNWIWLCKQGASTVCNVFCQLAGLHIIAFLLQHYVILRHRLSYQSCFLDCMLNLLLLIFHYNDFSSVQTSRIWLMQSVCVVISTALSTERNQDCAQS